MTTDRLFVIMLVMLIPMTGCFGAVDNADAEDNDGETIVNNYYYNNTTTVIEPPVIEKFTTGGVIDWNLTSYIEEPNNPGYRVYFPYNFTTVAGEFVSVHYFSEDDTNSVRLITDCEDGSSFISYTSTLDQGAGVWGSHTSCVHTVKIYSLFANINSAYASDYEDGSRLMAWSLLYSIESVTVV